MYPFSLYETLKMHLFISLLSQNCPLESNLLRSQEFILHKRIKNNTIHYDALFFLFEISMIIKEWQNVLSRTDFY